MKGDKCVCMYVCTEHETLWSLVKNHILSTCIQIINTHGDTIYVFLWMEEDRQFLWSWH